MVTKQPEVGGDPSLSADDEEGAGKKERAKEDAELAAMKKIGFILGNLEVSAARRVLDYVTSRHLDRQVVAKRAEMALDRPFMRGPMQGHPVEVDRPAGPF